MDVLIGVLVILGIVVLTLIAGYVIALAIHLYRQTDPFEDTKPKPFGTPDD